MTLIDEHQAEQATLDWFEALGYERAFGPDLAPEGSPPERVDYKQVVLRDRFMAALRRINPHLPASALEDAARQVIHGNVPSLMRANRAFHRWVTDGVPVEVQRAGETLGDRVKLVDFANAHADEEVRHMQHRNLAVELLERLLKDEIKARFKTNVVQTRKFSELLQASLARYRNRAIETAQVIEELIGMAKSYNDALRRGQALGLSPEEIVFYDALETNEASVRELGDHELKAIARELTGYLRGNLTVDWSVRESVRAAMRLRIKLILKRHKYPPDLEQRAVELVMRQAEVLAEAWTSQGL